MGTTRTSNKDILSAIESQTQAINALVNALTEHAPAHTPAGQIVDPEPVAAPKSDTVRIPEGYKNHMMAKVQAKADEVNGDYIMYARRNLAGEVKLAYCTAERWTNLKDNGLIGPVAHIKPE